MHPSEQRALLAYQRAAIQQAVELAVPEAVNQVKGPAVVGSDGVLIEGTTTANLAAQFVEQRSIIAGQLVIPAIPPVGNKRWKMSLRFMSDRLDTIEMLRDERGLVIDQQRVDINALQPMSYPVDNQSTVTITHNLGRWVAARFYLPSGQLLEGGQWTPDLNTFSISFSTPQTGTLVLF